MSLPRPVNLQSIGEAGSERLEAPVTAKAAAASTLLSSYCVRTEKSGQAWPVGPAKLSCAASRGQSLRETRLESDARGGS